MTATQSPERKKGRRARTHTPCVFQREFIKPDGTKYVGEVWHVCYPVPDPKRPGKTKMRFESSKSKRKGDAEQLLLKRRAEYANLIDPERVGGIQPTFQDFVEKIYLPESQEDKAFHKKKLVCDQLVQHFKEYKLDDITPLLIQQYHTKKRTETSPSTANRHLTILKNIFNVASSPVHRKITHGRNADIRTVKKFQEPAGRIEFYSKQEIKELKNKLKAHNELRQIVLFALYSGLRKGRVLKLRWSDVDLVHGRFQIPTDKHGDSHRVPIHPEAIKILKEREQVKQEGDVYVFVNPKTKTAYAEPPDMWDEIKGDYCFHTLRHTYISHLVMAGVDLRTVQQLAGHKTLAMTMKYAHLSPEHETNAIKRLSF
ncbi:MAG: site-specific integrase [Geobacteraceae bacterium]|nr:site-specific integrase [Geobacteraceae bacterium]